MPRYQYVGAEPRYFPTLGLALGPVVDDEGDLVLDDEGRAEPVYFETELPVSHPDVLTEEGEPTVGIDTPNNVADVMDPLVDDEVRADETEVPVEPEPAEPAPIEPFGEPSLPGAENTPTPTKRGRRAAADTTEE